MSPPPLPARYTPLAMALHWLMAALIVAAFGVGLYMGGLPFSPARLRLINLHKWFGVTVLALSALRLLWRLSHRPPPLPEAVRHTMPRWQRVARAATHGLLYVLFFAVPLLGWAYSSAAGFPVVWMGVVPLPDLLAADAPLARDVLLPLHRASAFALAGLVVLHAGGALKHHFVDHDGLLARMWPARRP